VAGISFLDSILGEAGIDPLEHNLLVSDALTPVVHPDSVAVYAQVYDQAIASNLKLRLLKAYPPEHAVIVTAYGREPTHVELAALDRQPHFDHLTSVIVPALPLEEAAGSFEGIHEVVRRLRAPDGCPWDREQTNRSITKYLIEECYEAIDALESGDMSTFASELGDVLLQVLLHAQIADDEGNFDITDVMSAIHRKLVRRHPHVFGDLAVSSAEEVVVNWDALKEQEREPDASVLSSVPAGMPALALAQGLQERAARYGFDWANRSDVVAKVMEEIGELQTAQTDADRYHEYGDVLFALINVARWDGVEAEEALRAAAARFRSRFAHIERRARETGVPLDQLGLEQMDRYWDEAKALERAQPG
jgi:tetrapyrrole methylase family protein/MazG family protein